MGTEYIANGGGARVAGTVDHAWLSRTVSWPLTGKEELILTSLSQTGESMGSVHLIECDGRFLVVKGEAPRTDDDHWATWAATSGPLQREAALYRFLNSLPPDTPKLAPVCYWASVQTGSQAGIALEYVHQPDKPASTMATGLSLGQATAAVRTLAALHAETAALVTRPESLPWLYEPTSPDLITAIRLGLEDLPQVIADHWPHAKAAEQAARRVSSADVESICQRSHRDANLTALCHGDAWAANVLFTSAGQGAPLYAVLIDWQFAMRGNPLSDIALLLLSSVEPKFYDDWRDGLLQDYCDVLVSRGFHYPLTMCKKDYWRAEAFAVLVALASIEAYISGMNEAQLERFSPRLHSLLRRAASPESEPS